MERRVLRVITRLNIGGPARHALLLSKALAPAYRTLLAAGTPALAEGELRDEAVPIRRVPLVRPVAPLADARALVALARIVRDERPHLVHTHMAKAGFLGRVAASAVRPRPRTVHTFHGHVLEGYFGPAAQRIFLAAERALARRTDLLVTVSGEIRDQLLELGVGCEEQYRVVPLGLDLHRHRGMTGPSKVLRKDLGLADDVPLIGTVGRLVPIKDLHTLLRAMVRLTDAHLAVVGDGEQRRELEGLATTLGIGDRVHFTGWRQDVAAVMSDLDIVVLTSRNEGTPVSLIEAAACGRPVVATSVGGVPSVVADGVSGLLVPPGDDGAVADAVERLLGDTALRVRMGEEGRARSAAFDADRLVTDVRRLYDELLS